MALTVQQQNQIWQRFTNPPFLGGVGGICLWDQNDLRAAVLAIDGWITANQANFVAALQAGAPNFASNSTAAQKTALFCFVAEMRAGLI